MKQKSAPRGPSRDTEEPSARDTRRILLSPIGNFDPGIYQPVMQKLDQIFGFKVEEIPLLKNLEFALDEERDQYHSTPILQKLSDAAPSHAVKVLGVTRVDLFIPILTHVYGEAQLGGKACIISTYRLDERTPSMGREITLHERVFKEAVHELGHTFKLRHCRDQTCIMHYCRNVADVDRKSNQFCRYCKILLSDEIKRLAKK
ncbi:archaemetzincin family Zn-dependent metalloprotease [Thermodesulfobacteriota bacterium]